MVRRLWGLSLVIVWTGIFISSSWAISNGTFENGTLNYWAITTRNYGTAQVKWGTAHNGEYSAWLNLGGADSYAKIYQPESGAEEGETWTVEGWCYNFAFSGGTCRFGWDDHTRQMITKSTWSKYTDTMTFGSATAHWVAFSLEGIRDVSAYLDDVVAYRVFRGLNHYESFDVAKDTTYWFFEKYGDGTGSGTLSWISTYNNQNGVVQITQDSGEKGQLSRVFTVSSAGWYTATAMVATDISDQANQQKVYLYLQELGSDYQVAATGNIVLQSGKGGFSGANIWRNLKISFYATNTILSVQVVAINPITTGLRGSLYIDNVVVTAGAAQPTGSTAVKNTGFTSNISNWTLEVYGDGYGTGTWGWLNNYASHTGLCYATQTSGQKGKISQTVNLPYAQHDVIGSLWVYSGATAKGNIQKIYLYIYSYNNSSYDAIVESGNAILEPGKWTPGVWRELKFGYSPLTNYNVVQIVGINKAGQPTQAIYFDSVSVKQD
ncbi:MAG: hypothetical protein ACE14V_10560 [bacterium]